MKNFCVCQPPPQDWSLVEESLPLLIMIENSDEDDIDDMEDQRNGLIGMPGPSQHPTLLPINKGALIVAVTTADL
ncbi:hypothetical protein EDD85DRAFT_943424 [Armillaria nabsnona]|nr:hypothetical protein EDD85DRAFT_943424 [Armillaria nabsnona]